MRKIDYLDLIRDVDTELELTGIRNAADADPSLLQAEMAEIDKAIGLRTRFLRGGDSE